MVNVMKIACIGKFRNKPWTWTCE